MNHQILLQQYIELIESLSPESKVSRFCKEAGFMRIVEVGQYFVTKDTGDLRQFQSVACREHTLPRDDQASQPKGWFRGNMRIGPVLEVTTVFSISSMELKFELSRRTKTILNLGSEYPMERSNMWSIQINTEILTDPHEDQTSQTSIKVVAARSKAEAKPQKRELVVTPRSSF